MKKFYFSDFEIDVFDGVYEPADDSVLIAEAIEKGNLRGKKALDMGCGSGFLGILLAKKGFDVTSADIDENALKNTAHNAKRAKLGRKIKAKKSNLFSSLKGKKFDFIVFNPPYVESESLKWRDVDGGKGGREILDCFLKDFGKHLKKQGICFFLQSSLNGIAETEKMLKKQKFSFGIIARKKLFFEELIVFKVSQCN